MKKLLILTVMFLFSVASIAKDIKGRVVDDSGNPLEFVNVLLMKDSSFVAGVISDGDGRFNFSSGTGDATKLKLSFIGYETQLLNITANGDMGTVKMMPASTELKGIVVKGIASSTHLKGNTLITNVENGILAHAGTAKDVLAKVPMRINRAFIVALNKIRTIDRNYCVYIDNEIIRVTDTYRDAFQQYLDKNMPK